jgi:glycogen(starch) synthase
MQKVLMSTEANGGVLTYTIELASWLAGRGIGVIVASMGPLSGQQRTHLILRGVQLVEGNFRLEWMDEPWNDVRAAGHWLLELEREYHPSIIHLNGYAHAAVPFSAPVVVVAHSSVLSRWRAIHGEDAPGFERYRAEVTRGLRAASRVVATSHAMLQALLQHEPWLEREARRSGTRLTSGKLRVIENGLQRPNCRREDKQEFIFTTGRLGDAAKNFELLASIAPALAWPILVAGDRQQEDETAAFDASVLEVLGPAGAEQLARWLKATSIFAAPSLYEPFGLSILEAAAAGCALVLGDIPSLRELWGGASLLIDPRDPVAWHSALQSLLDDADSRHRLSLSAQARAQRYGNDRMGAAYVRLYEEVAKPIRRSRVEA